MKRSLIVIVALLAFLSLRAQTNKDLTFVYIAHDENTNILSLIDQLKTLYDEARNAPESHAVIFYLPNGNYPITVRVNTAGDNQDDFALIVEDIQKKRSHDVEREVDLKKIQDIFNETDIIDSHGGRKYSHVEWIYYVNSTFWELGNNENIISSLFWIMDMEKYVKDGYLGVFIYYGEDDPIPYDETLPFGNKALCRSVNFIPMPY